MIQFAMSRDAPPLLLHEDTWENAKVQVAAMLEASPNARVNVFIAGHFFGAYVRIGTRITLVSYPFGR